MLEKTVTIGDKEVKFRSSATIPRLYRIKFKRDIFKDLSKLEASYSKKKNEDGSFAIEDLEIFENVAYIMAYHADHTIPDNIDDWLDQFEMFSIEAKWENKRKMPKHSDERKQHMREVMIQKWRERHGESDNHSGNDQPVYGSAD